jgi:uncharacterized membrane protein (UPF0127 family)
VTAVCPTRFVATACAGLVLATTSGAQSIESRALATFPNGMKVSVEVADRDAERARGLMFRKTLAPDQGKLFLFEERGIHPFWMKNTLISLDILWLDSLGTIVSIAHTVPPCIAEPCPHYSPNAEACAVMAVMSGFAKQHGVRVGDRVKFGGGRPGRARDDWLEAERQLSSRATGPRDDTPVFRITECEPCARQVRFRPASRFRSCRPRSRGHGTDRGFSSRRAIHSDEAPRTAALDDVACTRTEHGASVATRFDTLPSTIRASALRPCEPMTMRSACQSIAFCITASAGAPTTGSG